MLETNINNFSDLGKYHVDFKIKTKLDDIREDIKDSAIRIIFCSKQVIEGTCKKDELCPEGVK